MVSVLSSASSKNVDHVYSQCDCGVQVLDQDGLAHCLDIPSKYFGRVFRTVRRFENLYQYARELVWCWCDLNILVYEGGIGIGCFNCIQDSRRQKTPKEILNRSGLARGATDATQEEKTPPSVDLYCDFVTQIGSLQAMWRVKVNKGNVSERQCEVLCCLAAVKHVSFRCTTSVQQAFNKRSTCWTPCWTEIGNQFSAR